MISIRLESLHLKNWQSYKDVEIDFKGPKSTRNSAILYARNSKGKSAFFESIQFLLYGKEEIKIRDADMQKPLVHKNKGFWPLMNYEAYLAGETELRVRAKFSDKDGKTFEISRGWVAKKPKASESDFTERFVIFDSKKEKIPNPEAFIELMLPKEIVKFFMIDGERLIDYRKLFSPDTATKGGLARATEELLRMYVLDNTIACMGGLTASIKKAKRLEESRLAKAKGKAGKLTKLSNDISTCEKEILELEKKEKKLSEAIDEDLSWMKKNGDEEAIIKKIDDCQDLIDDSEELIGNQKDILGEQIKNSWKAIMSPMITASINAETTKIERQGIRIDHLHLTQRLFQFAQMELTLLRIRCCSLPCKGQHSFSRHCAHKRETCPCCRIGLAVEPKTIGCCRKQCCKHIRRRHGKRHGLIPTAIGLLNRRR